MATASFKAVSTLGGLAAVDDLSFQHHALAGVVLTGENRFEHGVKLVERHAGEESKPAQIHGEHRDVATSQRARCGEQRAVAAKDDQQINLFHQLFARQRWAIGADHGPGLLVDKNANFALVQPLSQRRDDGGDHFGDRFADDAGGANHCWRQNSTLDPRAGVEKKLLVAFGAGDAAGTDTQ